MSGNESQLVQNTFGFLCVFVWFFDVPNPIQFRNENGSFFSVSISFVATISKSIFSSCPSFMINWR